MLIYLFYIGISICCDLYEIRYHFRIKFPEGNWVGDDCEYLFE